MAIIELDLISGTQLWAYEVHVEATYFHVYEGLPYKESNDGYLALFPERVRRIFHGPYRVHVIEPARTVDEKRRSPWGPVEYLPDFWCVAIFHEFRKGAPGRCLAVVWFEEEPFPLPSDTTRARLSALDWERLAEDFTP